jgi:phosphoglycolate phosphatase
VTTPTWLRAVAFDLDGTLVDSRRDIAEAANHALEKSGRARLSHAELESYVGDGAPPLIARAARLDVDSAETNAMVADFLDFYAAHPVDYTTLTPGALEALRALDGLALAVCTNKPRRTAVAVLEGLGLASRFRSLVAGDDLPERKPHPSMLRTVARQLSVHPSELVMVGDGPQDIEAGRAAGSATVGVRGGIQGVERLVASAPDELIDTLAELPAALTRLSSPASGTRR